MRQKKMKKMIRAVTAAALAAGFMLGSLGAAGFQAEAASPDGSTVIVLDPGHGGSDPGACRTIDGITYCERDLVLKIAFYCKDELEKHGITVYMTRTDNTSTLMDRSERAAFAQQKGADVLVSFHLNATGSETTTATGAMIYSPNYNYNSSIGTAGNNISVKILEQLAGLGLQNNGVAIWNSDDTYYPDGTIADYLGINYFCKMKGFPGVLIEHAFINNPSDVAGFLSTEDQLRSLGIADAQGILNCLASGELVYNSNPGSWRYNSVGWWYSYANGGYPVSTWEQIDGKWYYFNSSGYMATGWVNDGAWYYLNASGALTTGWQYVNGNWYYMNSDGRMATGWIEDAGKLYYLRGSGAMATGWVNDGGWHYMNGSGAAVTGWVWDGSNWYYMDSDGRMVTGWVEDAGKNYYLQGSGAMATGWLNLGGTWYYFNTSGAMTTGWQYVNGYWYYLNEDGTMAANTWIGSYYINGNGAWVN